MTTVWAARNNTGIWVDPSKGGDWRYVITFSDLGDLSGNSRVLDHPREGRFESWPLSRTGIRTASFSWIGT